MKIVFLPALTLLCLPVAASATEWQPSEIEFFEQRIRPVLVEQCYECHNTSETAEAELSLDYHDALRQGGESGTLLPKDPADSLLLKVLKHEIEGLEMPEGGEKLDDDVIADFEKWMSMGAPDPRSEPPTEDELASSTSWPVIREKRKQWWSFQPIIRPEIPAAKSNAENSNAENSNAENSNAARDHAIDRFVQAKMEASGLVPAGRAERSVLARRLSFALVGLPPTPASIAQFVDDPSQGAYEKYVDRLLNSDHFGERWARHWMDWIRYAESHGSEGDPRIAGAHHYRDYLIRALNDDVPYDEMVREHIAGDLLDTPRINDQLGINESQLATAHWRMVFHGFAPTDAMEEKMRFTDDSVNVFSKAFLGLTVSCARCHDHKFDAISQADYYALFGIVGSTRPARAAIDSPDRLNRNRESLAALKSQIRDKIATSWLDLVSSDDELLDAISQDKARLTPVAKFFQSLREADDFPAAWQRLSANVAASSNTEQSEAVRHWDLSQPVDHKAWFAYGNGTVDQASPAGEFTIAEAGELVVRDILPSGVFSHLLSDKHAAVFTSPSFPLDDEYDLWLRVDGDGAAISRFVVQDYPRNGTVFPFTKLNQKEQPGWRWQKYDLSYWKGDDIHIEMATANDSAILVQGKDRSWFGIRDAVVVPKNTPWNSDLNKEWLQPILKRAEADSPTSMVEFAGLLRRSIRDAVAAWQRKDLSDAEAILLDQCVKSGILANTLESLEKVEPLVQRYRQLESVIPVPRRAPALAEWAGADQPLYLRGDHKQPVEKVPRRFLEAFDGTPYQSKLSGRRELAASVLNESNPLTSRVIVNRIWHHLFGRGIVGTNDNFGRLGETPTHPELLDYLASEFRSSDDWSIKSMIRRIVTSDTWCQDAVSSAPAKTIDPTNKFYSHWSVTRLEAEAIRDAVLSVAGKLDAGMYGQAVAGKSSRRSVYVKVIRNALDPFLATFDAPVPFSSKGRRDVTNVPAQSLLMMNDSFVLDAARKFSGRSFKQDAIDDDRQRVGWLWREALGRRPTDEEIQSAIAFVESSSAMYGEMTEHRRQLQSDFDRHDAELQSIVDAAVKRIGAASVDSGSTDLHPISEWSFESSADDQVGQLDLKLEGSASISKGALILDGNGFARTSAVVKPLHEKTLEAVVQLSTLEQAAGGVMTVQDLSGTVFDSIVFAEKAKGQWLSGSEHHRRSKSFDGQSETDAANKPVHLAISYAVDGRIICYRNGHVYGTSYKASRQSFSENDFEVVFGMRHGKAPSGNRMLRGRILHARLYDRVLTLDEVHAAAIETVNAISPEQIEQTLSRSELKRRNELQVRLKSLRSEMATLPVNVEANQAWVDIAHSLFNMKEFIYVR
ncbi:DUF1553 domain-containing protein [Stieleria marina]|uniref:Planctomycete cytochrome C n=1 Tax=Stieleria marina TaxID=1930275 RepID=A0A517NT70_9BACT|nr:Planctomycete cytochrome C [Planctomycetes bacterium K23_9]